MPGNGGITDADIVAAVRNGSLPEDCLDAALRRILELTFRVADAPPAPRFDAAVHHALARKAARESLVLLKNEARLLPLDRGSGSGSALGGRTGSPAPPAPPPPAQAIRRQSAGASPSSGPSPGRRGTRAAAARTSSLRAWTMRSRRPGALPAISTMPRGIASRPTSPTRPSSRRPAKPPPLRYGGALRGSHGAPRIGGIRPERHEAAPEPPRPDRGGA